ncbi:MAG TPA: hypothetical protein VFV23_02720 [Verrucomicrobiae bacterium]|nr:hypothetical protein [Verrucomicrobiae bacterium]
MNRFFPKLNFYLIVSSIGGLILCRIINALFFRNGNNLDQTIVGLWILRSLAIVFGVTVLILVPLSVILGRSHVKEVQKLWAEEKNDPEQLHPFWKFLFYSNYGNVPRWIYLPFIIIASILIGILALSLIVFIGLAIIWLFLHYVLSIK